MTAIDPRVDVVTTSWGSCEVGSDPNEVAADNDLFGESAERKVKRSSLRPVTTARTTAARTTRRMVYLGSPTPQPWNSPLALRGLERQVRRL